MEESSLQEPIEISESPEPEINGGGISDENESSTFIDKDTQRRYRVFKKNSPYVYDYLVTNSLLWPSLSVQFFPDLEVADATNNDNSNSESTKKNASAQLAHQRLLLGTFTLGQAVDAIHLYQVPYYRNLNKCIDTDHWTYNAEKEEFELPTVSKTKPRVLQSINHFGDVNKLRYMPQNPDIIASANNVGDLHVYNRTKHATIRKLGEENKVNAPQLRLVNSSDGEPANTDIFALDWNNQTEGMLVSGSMASQINVYDIRGQYRTRSENNTINHTWTADIGVGVNDIEWVHQHNSVFLTADDKGALSVFDTRGPATAIKSVGGDSPKNSLSINPSNDFCVATGSAMGQIDVWDLRALQNSARSFSAHLDAITQVKWHPKFKSVLGSSSADRSVKLFDVAESETPLLFSHEGHMLGVNDFDWSLHEDWMVASVADDNSLHLWKPAHHVITRNYN